jgi:tetratricopeptide (TPR) repeat protein
MFTNKARIFVAGLFILIAAFAIQMKIYEITGVAILFIGLLLWGYYKQGTIVLAAKAFHQKDYARAEELLRQVPKPDMLSKNRRGFYEFIYGGVCMQKRDYEEAEQHYELAAQYPLRSANDHVAALVHVANISIRNGNYDKARAYLSLTDKHKENITAKMKDVILKVEQELSKHK